MWSPNDLMVNKPDWYILVSEFELHSHYGVQFWINTLRKTMNTFIFRVWVK